MKYSIINQTVNFGVKLGVDTSNLEEKKIVISISILRYVNQKILQSKKYVT